MTSNACTHRRLTVMRRYVGHLLAAGNPCKVIKYL